MPVSIVGIRIDEEDPSGDDVKVVFRNDAVRAASIATVAGDEGVLNLHPTQRISDCKLNDNVDQMVEPM